MASERLKNETGSTLRNWPCALPEQMVCTNRGNERNGELKEERGRKRFQITDGIKEKDNNDETKRLDHERIN